MDCTGRHRVRLYSYRYLKLVPRPGAYRVKLRRSEYLFLCWSQYLSEVGNSPRQTASPDKHSRKIQRPYCSVAACRITGSNAQFDADQHWSAWLLRSRVPAEYCQLPWRHSTGCAVDQHTRTRNYQSLVHVQYLSWSQKQLVILLATVTRLVGQ